MGNNKHGNANEKEMATYLDKKKYAELNLPMKEFIKYICATKKIDFDDNTIISSSYETNNKLKQDIYISINGYTFGISMKMGNGNSCHQEKIDDFIQYIKKNFGACDDICNSWKFFIWSDGTLDGSGSLTKNSDGKIISRFDAKVYKKTYPDERAKLQKFLNDNKKELLDHVIFVGKYNSNVDFVYHGKYDNGRWISKEEIIEYLMKQTGNKKACLTLGNLTVQAWNVSLKGNTDYKRGQIQIKYGQMENDFNKLMKETSNIGTLHGDLQENDLCKLLNNNKKSKLWHTLLPNETDFKDFYAVRVASMQFSKLSNKNVKTKSDAYIIKAELPHELLLSKQYSLNENDIKDYNYKIINESGISIKMIDSDSFTFQKFTKNSFFNAFSKLKNSKLIFTSLLIYSNLKEIYKNKTIINDLGFSSDNEYYRLVELNFGIKRDETKKLYWDLIRKKAQETLKKAIVEDKELHENIFIGKYWFEAPYHANFIYEHGVLKQNTITDFTITTGSGRSSGKYTIEIKPIKKSTI